MKLRDIIKCRDEKDLKQTFVDLDLAGFHAVRDSSAGYNIIITGVPEAEYLVQAWDQNGIHQSCYCSTLEEAEVVATHFGDLYKFVEILKGYPGEWEPVSRSW